jgi:pimeloyl-ACP methyl ester carboxylesterase
MALEEFVRLLELIMRVRGFERRVHKADGVELAFHQHGRTDPDATRIVLVHGLGNSSVVWMKCLGPLGRGHFVQAIDLPGFGQSPAPEGHAFASVTQMRDALVSFLESDPRPAVLVGQSLGGWVSMKTALARPDLVEQLVLVNTAGILYPQVHELRELLMVTSREEIKAFWRRLWHRIPWINHLFINDFIARTDEPIVSGFLASLGSGDFLNEELHGMKVPTSIFWGVSDRFIPRLCVDVMVRELPETRVLWVPRCGHIPQLERPKMLTRFIRQLVAEPPPAPPA